jgi:hypothetical protein
MLCILLPGQHNTTANLERKQKYVYLKFYRHLVPNSVYQFAHARLTALDTVCSQRCAQLLFCFVAYSVTEYVAEKLHTGSYNQGLRT